MQTKPKTHLLLLFLFLRLNCRELIKVIQIIRHGARDYYLKNGEEKQSANAFLTNKGFWQMENLGAQMAKKYANKLKISQYSSDEVKIVLSARSRCEYSAKAYFHGFFGKIEGSEKLKAYKSPSSKLELLPNVEAKLNRFKMEKIGLHNNFLFRSHVPITCPNMLNFLDQKDFSQDPEITKFIDIIFAKLKKNHFDYKKIVKGLPSKIFQIKTLHDYFYSTYFYHGSGKTPPIPLHLFKIIRSLQIYLWYKKRRFDKKIYSSLATPLLKAIKNDITLGVNDLNSSSRKKFVLYSGQDSAIYTLLNSLGFAESDCYSKAVNKKKAVSFSRKKKCMNYPQFGDSLTFEVSLVGLSFMVSVLYNNKVILTSKIEKFLEHLSNLQDVNFISNCFGDQTDDSRFFQSQLTGVDLAVDEQLQIKNSKEINIMTGDEGERNFKRKDKEDYSQFLTDIPKLLALGVVFLVIFSTFFIMKFIRGIKGVKSI